jgi:mannose-6-phosphate isomerase
VRALTNPVRPYAWGSRTAIATLQGRPAPSATAEAELWMGAHPSAPSRVDGPDGESLGDLISRMPEPTLGRAVVDRFGARLPYLLKVLAAAHPLSLQAHPDEEQARAGFAAEAGLAAGGPAMAGSGGPALAGSAGVTGASERNYADPYHKPELLVAVEEFEALCGFRDPETSATVLDSFGVPALAPVSATLRRGPAPTALRAAVHMLLTWSPDDRTDLVAAVTRAGRTLAARAPHEQAPHALATRLGALYPDDVGVVVALLLNHVRLRPDEAVFMPAGNLHAYLSGLGVEVMAASDNVLRGGLTPKHVDVPELLRVLRYEVLPDPVVRPEAVAPGLLRWPAPAAEFALVKASVEPAAGPVVLPGRGPRVVVCLRGPASVTAGDEVRILRGGDAVFVPAADPPVELGGGAAGAGSDQAVVFQAAVPA